MAPTYGNDAAAALIRGTLYVVGHGGHGSTDGFYKLEAGVKAWSTFPAIKGTTQFDGVWIGRVSNPVFYCTINGVGTAEDGFYIFYLSGSAVYVILASPPCIALPGLSIDCICENSTVKSSAKLSEQPYIDLGGCPHTVCNFVWGEIIFEIEIISVSNLHL